MSSKLWLRIVDVVVFFFVELGVCKYRPIRHESADQTLISCRAPPARQLAVRSLKNRRADPAAAVVVNQRIRRKKNSTVNKTYILPWTKRMRKEKKRKDVFRLLSNLKIALCYRSACISWGLFFSFPVEPEYKEKIDRYNIGGRWK
jgi:hypothetical protein